MDKENAKGKPLMKEETRFLLDLVEGSKYIISKETNASNNKLKTAEWVKITERFNAHAVSCPRLPAQLRLKWENLKKNARKRSTTIRMNQIKTGGGPADYIPPDDILDRVTGLLGSTASGFTVPFGGDREVTNPINDCDGDGGSGSSVMGDARVIVESQDILEPISLETNVEIVTCGDGNGGGGDGGGWGSVSGCEVLNLIDSNKRKFSFSTPRVNKKFKKEKITRDQAITDYFIARKEALGVRLDNFNLENNNLKLRNKELELSNIKLKLEIEKLKLELDKFKQLCNIQGGDDNTTLNEPIGNLNVIDYV